MGEDEELAAASAFCRSEAAGGIVETKFEDLFAITGAAVAGEDCALSGSCLTKHERAVSLRNKVHEG